MSERETLTANSNSTSTNTKISDIQNSTNKDKKDEDLMSKDNSWLNKLFMFLTIVCYVGTFIMIFRYDKYWRDYQVHRPEGYQIPKLSDFKLVLVVLPILIGMKLFFEKYVTGFMYHFLSAKYKNPQDEENHKLGKIYKKKLATGLFKVTYYTLSVIIGHFILKNMTFFPPELMGNGLMENMYNNGDPGILFFDKPEYFDLYYLTGLAFVITDLIWLLFFYEIQSDFYLMLLHHSITISLVVFSYLTNLSQIGIIVFYLHDITDVFVYIVRIVINTDFPDWIKIIPCVLLLASYLFFRIYLLGKLIYLVYMESTVWDPYKSILWGFKCILMIMHIYWVSQIIKRFLNFNIEDVGKVKKKNK